MGTSHVAGYPDPFELKFYLAERRCKPFASIIQTLLAESDGRSGRLSDGWEYDQGSLGNDWEVWRGRSAPNTWSPAALHLMIYVTRGCYLKKLTRVLSKVRMSVDGVSWWTTYAYRPRSNKWSSECLITLQLSSFFLPRFYSPRFPPRPRKSGPSGRSPPTHQRLWEKTCDG